MTKPWDRVLGALADWRSPWVLIGCLSIADVLQTVYLSYFTGFPGPLWKVWIYELSSGAVLLSLLWPVRIMSRRFSWRQASPTLLVAHAFASLVFSVVHVLAMVGIRKLAFVALGTRYTFGEPLPGFAYEYGKDVFSYLFFVSVFWLNDWSRDEVQRRRQINESRAKRSIAVRTSRGLVAVPFDEIRRIEATGNYVTLVTESHSFLHRATMREIEQVLSDEHFARSHRSHIVSQRAIKAVRSRRNGERTLELSTGEQIPLSRAYANAREWLVPLSRESASSPTA